MKSCFFSYIYSEFISFLGILAKQCIHFNKFNKNYLVSPGILFYSFPGKSTYKSCGWTLVTLCEGSFDYKCTYLLVVRMTIYLVNLKINCFENPLSK